MSLYRQPGRFSTKILAIAASGALLVGVAGGFAVGNATGGDDAPSLGAQIGDLRSALSPAQDGLELLPNEYAQALGGEPTEMEAVTGQFKRVESIVTAHAVDLRALSPRGASAVRAALRVLGAGIADREPDKQVAAKADGASAALTAALGR